MDKIIWRELHPNRICEKYDFHNYNADKWESKNQHLSVERLLICNGLACVYQRWKDSGSAVYNIDKQLVKMLSKTDVGSVNESMIKLPFETLYVNVGDFRNDIEGFYISDGGIPDGRYRHKKYINLLFGIVLKGSEIEKNFEITLTDIDTVSSELRNLSYHQKSGKYDCDYLTIEACINLCINVLLYISLPNADIKKEYPSDLPKKFIDTHKNANSEHRKAVNAAQIKSAGYSIINLVGSSFTKQHQTNAETHTVATHWRRGHWRNQPYKNKESELIWIMPMIINADKGEPIKGHIYKG